MTWISWIQFGIGVIVGWIIRDIIYELSKLLRRR